MNKYLYAAWICIAFLVSDCSGFFMADGGESWMCISSIDEDSCRGYDDMLDL